MAHSLEADNFGLELDVGNLVLVDPRPLTGSTAEEVESLILAEMTKLSQKLLSQVWALPLERIEDAIVATLPKSTTFVPREKPIPKPKPMTKWERYAKDKGIQKTKKSRLVWDQEKREWLPRWGYKKAGDPDDDWMTEVPDNSDGMDDAFEQRKKAKQERVSKNDLQRLKNIARTHKTKIPHGGVLPNQEGQSSSKEQISKAAAFAKTATASVGKFTESLPKEKPPKNIGKKRKFEDNVGDLADEKTRSLKVLDGVTSKKPKVDMDKALGRIKKRSDKPKRERQPLEEGDNRGSFRGGRGGGRGGRGGGGRGGFSSRGKPSKGPAFSKSRKPTKSPHRG